MPKSPLSSLFSLMGFENKPKVSPYQEAGVSGTAVYGGFVQNAERNPVVAGYRRYETFSDIMINTSIVAAGMRYFLGLATEPKWTIVPAADLPDGQSSDAAKEAAEFVELVRHDIGTSWHRIVRRSGMYRFYGYAIQEWQASKREDGLIGIANIEARPQHTIWQWDIDPVSGQVKGVVQRSPQTGELFCIPRWKLIYLVDDTLSDSPEGLGLLRQVAEPAERLKEYLKIEGIGFDRDLRGTPIGRAPIAELEDIKRTNPQDEKLGQNIDAAIAAMRSFVQTQAKDVNTGLLLDSTPFKNIQADGHSWSSSLRWGLELLQGNSTGIEHLGESIERTNFEIARVLGVETLMIGQSSGSRALSEDKSRNLYIQVNGMLVDMAEVFNRDLIGSLWTLNGFDNRLKPRFRPSEVSFISVEQVAATLRDMATAGHVLAADDPAIDFVRELLGAPHAPEPDPALMGV
ncbi:phage portal protein family protein [Phyllobacterium leguminum]|uniref:Portal protein n=1 Tax=Phyllobacterium leguminum TaxID=314237 RepID=A0A318TJY1_9HYPH|nr:hypothetical protein [Phyllobacterium leguminum]PYE89600.1 hypothetical protein C7477_103108 [Phyllobacterium leguminum]